MPARSSPVALKPHAETRRIMAKLAAQHPNADTALDFTTPYELLVATILSAQCTDERVNQVTPALFRRYPDARALAAATTAELEPQIQSTGFFRAKSRSLLGMAQALVEHHNGEVPNTLDALVALPGVGRKTANVVLGHALGVPGLPVDRHVLRVANRLGIARSDDPEMVEQQLCAAIPPTEWTVTSDTLILHGRRICKPRPLCDRCAVRDDCDDCRVALGSVRRRGSAVAPRASRAEHTASRAHEHGSGGAPRVRGPRRTVRTDQGDAANETPFEAFRSSGVRGAGNRAMRDRSESEAGSSLDLRRAPKVRGTGRGGGAPRQAKK